MGSVAMGAASLLVPLYVVELGGGPFALGLLGAVAAVIGAPGALVWGRLADRTARPRRIVVGSLLGVTVLLGFLPLLSSVALIVAANAVLWLVFAAAGPVLTLLVLADVPEAAWNREIAVLNKYQGYGWTMGLFVGLVWTGAVSTLVSPMMAQRSLFLASAGIAVAAAGLLGRWLPAPSDRSRRRITPRRVARILSTRPGDVRGTTFRFNPARLYWATRTIRLRALIDRFTPTLAGYYLGVVLFFVGFTAFFAPLPLYLADIGFSSEAVFGLYLLASLGSAFFFTGAGRLSARIDLRLLQTGALGVRGVAMPLVAVVGTALAAGVAGTVLLAGLFAVIGVTWAVIAVTAGTIVTRLAPRPVRGEALGVFAALSTLAGAVGSLAGGALADAVSSTAAFAAAGGVVVLGAIVVLTLHGISDRTHRPRDHGHAGEDAASRPGPEE